MVKQRMTLSSFIASQREKLGNISQVDLANRCGVPAGTIASIESGYAKSPRPVTLKKIADGLMVPAEIIYKLASNPNKELFIDSEELKTFYIPYLGGIPTKQKPDTINNIESQLTFPAELLEEGDFIVNIISDDFLDEDIYNGDFVVITKQDFLKRSGDLMLCYVHNVITLKRVYKNDSSFKIKGEAYSKEEISFLGKAFISISRRLL